MIRIPFAALAALSLLGALAAPAAPLSAQASAGADGGGTLVGRVLQAGAPVPAVPVTLHRVTNDSSGVMATVVTDAGGRFAFSLPPAADTSFSVYFPTADYLGVRYFGAPVHPSDTPTDYSVTVYDTTSTPAVPPRVARRDVVMLPISNGGWEVDEIVSVYNPTDRAIVGRSGMPAWEMRIPEEVVEFQAGEGDICATEMLQMEDRVLVVSPLAPGPCNLFFRYLIPAQRDGFELPVSAPTDTFNLYVQQPAPELTIEGLGEPGVLTAEGETFLRYETAGLDGTRGFQIDWTVEGLPPVDPVIAGVVAAAAILLVGGAMALRLRSTRP